MAGFSENMNVSCLFVVLYEVDGCFSKSLFLPCDWRRNISCGVLHVVSRGFTCISQKFDAYVIGDGTFPLIPLSCTDSKCFACQNCV